VCGTEDEGINNDYIANEVHYNNNLYKILSLNCGHACQWLRAGEFNREIEEFMQFIERNRKEER